MDHFIFTPYRAWALNQRFILLPLNIGTMNTKGFLGGLTCDSRDYNARSSYNAIFFT